jgi:hypothetical protein
MKKCPRQMPDPTMAAVITIFFGISSFNGTGFLVKNKCNKEATLISAHSSTNSGK